MPAPVPQPYDTLAPWEVRFHADGTRLRLEPVGASPRSRRGLWLMTAGLALVAAVPTFILTRTGHSEYVFIPVAFIALMWVMMMVTSTLTRRDRVAHGPILIVDPRPRTVELPHIRARLGETVPSAIHLIRFRLSNAHRNPHRIHIVLLRQLAIELTDADGSRIIPVVTGTFDTGVAAEARRLAAAPSVPFVESDAPDQRSEDWP